MDKKEIIAAIDFGSARAGYCFALTNDETINLCSFKCEKYKGKTLNKVILNDSNEVISYGRSVDDYLEGGNLKPNEHIYERIKMNLYNNIYKIQSSNTLKTLDIIDVITKILEYLKKHAIEKIMETTKGMEEKYDYDKETSKIRWVLTVPAIWDEKIKYIMMKASEKAGLLKDAHRNLFFALEPESASYYCLKNASINQEIFDQPYIVCDLGAGTGDIICHQRVVIDGIEKIQEKCTPKGGALGSDEINKKFENQVLKLLFGEDSLVQIHEKFSESLKNNRKMKNYVKRYINLKNDINKFKEEIDESRLEKTKNIDCSIFFKNNPNLDITSLVNEYNKKCNEEWKINEYGEDEDDRSIEFPYKIIYDMTKEITDKVSEILKQIISEVPNVSTIFYVGGFCNSKFAVNMIRENINSSYKNIKHIIPTDPDNAVLVGAVLYGLSPERIKSRKSKYTLGMHAYVAWEDKFEDGGIKQYSEEYGWVCQNGFYNFISINDDIPYDNCLTRPLKVVKNEDDGSYGGHVIIYKSLKTNTYFIDEEGVEKIGSFCLRIPPEKVQKGEVFLVTMEMGGTFLNVSAYHKESNTRVHMEFKY